jgi:hypothetical protein
VAQVLNPETEEVRKILALVYMQDTDQGPPDLYALKNVHDVSKEVRKAHSYLLMVLNDVFKAKKNRS